MIMRFVLPIALFFAAVICGVVEYEAGRARDRVEYTQTVVPPGPEFTLTTESLAPGDGATTKRLRVRAPLKNAWMGVTADVLDAEGSVFSTHPLAFDYYDKRRNGLRWTWGLPRTSALIQVPKNPYRLRLQISCKPVDALPPQVDVEVLPPIRGSRARLAACGILLVVATGLGMRGLTPRSRSRISQPRDSTTRQQKPAAPTPSGFAGAARPSHRWQMLDGLRGVAALLVLLCHLFVPEFMPSVRLIDAAWGPRIPKLMGYGADGVEIFFVLSGFVMAYGIDRFRVTPGFVARFLIRRFARLSPPYYVALAVALLVIATKFADSLYAVLPWYQSWTGIAINALYLQDLLAYRSPLGTVAWTLCLELQFYFALVVGTGVSQGLGRLLASSERQKGISRALWWLVLGTLAVASAYTWYPEHVKFSFLGVWFRFFLGAAVFRVLSVGAKPWPFATLLLVLAVASIGFGDTRGITAAATAGLILVAGNVGAMGRWLSGRVWQFLGQISYSLYIFHTVLAIPLVKVVWKHLPHSTTTAVLMVPLAIVVAVGTSWVMYVIIERPSVALSHRVRYAAEGRTK